jgi:hypothetical protein
MPGPRANSLTGRITVATTTAVVIVLAFAWLTRPITPRALLDENTVDVRRKLQQRMPEFRVEDLDLYDALQQFAQVTGIVVSFDWADLAQGHIDRDSMRPWRWDIDVRDAIAQELLDAMLPIESGLPYSVTAEGVRIRWSTESPASTARVHRVGNLRQHREHYESRMKLRFPATAELPPWPQQGGILGFSRDPLTLEGELDDLLSDYVSEPLPICWGGRLLVRATPGNQGIIHQLLAALDETFRIASAAEGEDP